MPLTDPLTAAEYVALIPAEFSIDPTAQAALSGAIETLWRVNIDKSFDLKLQYLYTKLAVVFWLLENDWPYFNYAYGDVQKQKKAIFDNLLALAKLLADQIKQVEQGLLKSDDVLCSRILVETYRNSEATWDTPYDRRAFPSAFNVRLDFYPLSDRVFP